MRVTDALAQILDEFDRLEISEACASVLLGWHAVDYMERPRLALSSRVVTSR